MQLLNNSVSSTVDRFINCSYWSANTFTDNQYSQVTIVAAHNSKGPAVRIQTGGAQQNYYYVKIENATQLSIKKNVNGSYALIPPSFTVPTLQPNDTIKLSVSGTTLELFVNGVSQGTRTDTTFSSGAPGIWNFFLLHPLDDWEGGSL
jgi:hypothetical protein